MPDTPRTSIRQHVIRKLDSEPFPLPMWDDSHIVHVEGTTTSILVYESYDPDAIHPQLLPERLFHLIVGTRPFTGTYRGTATTMHGAFHLIEIEPPTQRGESPNESEEA